MKTSKIKTLFRKILSRKCLFCDHHDGELKLYTFDFDSKLYYHQECVDWVCKNKETQPEHIYFRANRIKYEQQREFEELDKIKKEREFEEKAKEIVAKHRE